MKKLFILLFCTATAFCVGYGQELSEDEIRQELEGLGIDINDIQATDIERAEGELNRLSGADALQQVQDTSSGDFDIGQDLRDQYENIGEEFKEDVDRDIAQDVIRGVPLEESVSENIIDAPPKDSFPEAAIYGQQIFRGKSIGLFRQSYDIKASDDYQIGTGDEIYISIWGNAEWSEKFRVNSEGFIKPLKQDRIYVKAMTLQNLRNKLRSQYSKFFDMKNSQMEVNLLYSRTITVNIVGEVFEFGSYTIPAINTAFNALIAANGPTNIGSVRNIQIKRPGAPSRILDVYKFLMDANYNQDLYLRSNDYIYVPPADRVVHITGEIKRPFRYELTKNESLDDLVRYAGGLTEMAYEKNIKIVRYEKDRPVLKVVNFDDVRSGAANFELKNGDKVIIPTIPADYKNFVEVTGAVEYPGDYELEKGMRVSDLINRVGFDDDTRYDVAFIRREKPNKSYRLIRVVPSEALKNVGGTSDLELKRYDRIIFFSKAAIVENGFVSISGQVRNEGRVNFSKGMTLSDLLVYGNGLESNAYPIGYVFRTPDGINKQYFRVNFRDVLENPESESNLELIKDDFVIVFNKDRFQNKFFVRVSGEIREPGSILYDSTMTLKDAILISGGLKLEAARSRVEVSRLEFDAEGEKTRNVITNLQIDENYNLKNGAEFQLQPFDQIFVRTAPEFERPRNVTLEGEVKYPGEYTLISKNETILSVIQRAGGLTEGAFPRGARLKRDFESTGEVLLNLNEVVKNKTSKYNYILQANDLITIPKKKDFVSLEGEFKYIYRGDTAKINVPFHRNRNAKFYVNSYTGGLKKTSRKHLIYVIRANGQIDQTKRYLWFIKRYPKVFEGSTVVAEKRPPKKARTTEKKKINWEEFFTRTVTQATAALTLIVLARNLSN